MRNANLRAIAVVMGVLCSAVTHAVPIREVPDGSSNTVLGVVYTAGVINFGPLSFGLSALPTTVSAEFRLAPVAPIVGTPGNLNYGLGDVTSAGVFFGDASWTTLTSFDLEIQNGEVAVLSYAFSPTSSITHTGGIVLNFPLTITGMDITGQDSVAFSYTYSESSQTFRNVPAPATLALFGCGLFAFRLRRKA